MSLEEERSEFILGKKQLNSKLIYFFMIVVLMFQTIVSPIAIVAETTTDEEQSLEDVAESLVEDANAEDSSTDAEDADSSADVTESKTKDGLSKDDSKSEKSESKINEDSNKSSDDKSTSSTEDSSSKEAKDTKSDKEVSKDEPDKSKSAKKESEKVKTDLKKEYKVWDNSNMDQLKISDSDRLDINQDGLPFLNGDVFLVGGDGVDTSRFDKLMDRGIGKVIQTGDISLGDKFSMFFDKNFKPMTVSASSAPSIRRVGSATYKYSTVGIYEVNGELAYCIEHARPPAMTGLPYTPLKLYENAKVQRALYYGWGGDGNVFSSSQREEGLVITSLILSRVYNPGDDYTGDNYPNYDKLWDKVQNGSPPQRSINFSDHTLSISVKGGKQVSQTSTLKTGSDNSVKIKVPSKVTIVNDSTGKKVTGGTITIKGGQKFHLEAPLSYNSSYNSGDLKGTAKTLQPMLTKSKSGATQDLIKGTWAIDPTLTDSFKVPFKTQEVTMTVKHKDYSRSSSHKDYVFKTEKKKVQIGTKYKECRLSNSALGKYSQPYVKHPSYDNCSSGTVGSSNFTVNLIYSTQWNLTVKYINSDTGKAIYNKSGGKYRSGTTYKHVSPKWTTANPKYDGTLTDYYNTYDGKSKTTANRTKSGKMPRGNKTIEFVFDPYSMVSVMWRNKFPSYDIFKQTGSPDGKTGVAYDPENGKLGYTMDRYKVGDSFKYTQPKTFTIGSKNYDRVDSSTYSGKMGYAIKAHVFDYVLRRNLTVNYYDQRTMDKVRDTDSEKVHQGDKYSKTHPTIMYGEYEYDYRGTKGDPESGTVGTEHINIDYFYSKPLVKLGLDKLQVFTAPSEEGLPVRVYINKNDQYDSSVADMSNEDMKITVALYQGNTKLDSKSYTANKIPEELEFKVSPDTLNVNEVKPYTVKLEGYDEFDFEVYDGTGSLTTNGHTSTEEEVVFHTNDSLKTEELSRVVMTEITPTTSMKEYNENITYSLSSLGKEKSGYGVETDLNVTYENELGDEYNYATTVEDPVMDFTIDESLIESSLDHYIKEELGNGEVKLELGRDDNDSHTSSKRTNYYSYKFPSINIEKQTGELYSEQQVSNGELSSEQEGNLIDGGNKFYTPIWAELDAYDAYYNSTDVGVNKVKFEFRDTFNIYAQMNITMDSNTKDLDEIVFMPINADNPFAGGLPDNWTEEDAEWLKY